MSLTKEELQVIDGLKKLAAQVGPQQLTIAQVQSVTLDGDNAYTCEVETDTGDIIPDARLRAVLNGGNNVVYIPQVNSYVGITRIDNGSEWVVIAIAEIDKVIWQVNDVAITANNNIVLNGGNNGGLINIQPLIDKINRLENAFNTHTHLYVPYPGGIAAMPVPTQTVVEPIDPLTMKSDLEDTKITH